MSLHPIAMRNYQTSFLYSFTANCLHLFGLGLSSMSEQQNKQMIKEHVQ